MSRKIPIVLVAAIIAFFDIKPADARTFTVHFNVSAGQFDASGQLVVDEGCELSKSSRKLVAFIVKTWTDKGKPMISLVGHDDTSKNEKSSVAVSKCRTNAVAALLVRQGGPRR